MLSEAKHIPIPKRVLIVEDNDLNMKLFHDLLEAHGYDTLQTKDGIEALRLARQFHPDLILMDIQLPEVSGLEVTKWIKEDDELKAIPDYRRDGFCDEGRRGEDPRGRLRGLHRQAHLGRQFPADRRTVPELRFSIMTARILVVDDVEVNVRLLEAKLSAEYFTVLAAYDGFDRAAHGAGGAARHHPARRDDAAARRLRGLPPPQGRRAHAGHPGGDGHRAVGAGRPRARPGGRRRRLPHQAGQRYRALRPRPLAGAPAPDDGGVAPPRGRLRPLQQLTRKRLGDRTPRGRRAS